MFCLLRKQVGPAGPAHSVSAVEDQVPIVLENQTIALTAVWCSVRCSGPDGALLAGDEDEIAIELHVKVQGEMNLSFRCPARPYRVRRVKMRG